MSCMVDYCPGRFHVKILSYRTVWVGDTMYEYV